jgi:hypothetical protein
MSIIPLHIQRRFERRWAARFGSLLIPALPKNVGLKGSLTNMRRARQRPKKTWVEAEGEGKWARKAPIPVCLLLSEKLLGGTKRKRQSPTIKRLVRFRCTVICMRHVFFNCNACSLAGEVLVRGVEKARLLPIVADIVAKVFLGRRTKIFRAADAFYTRRREGLYRFIQIDHGSPSWS